MTYDRTIPIACSLDAGSFARRVAWIERLNRAHLLSYRREGLALELDYAFAALPLVRELARREAVCCAFLKFQVTEGEGDGRVRLRVEAPEAARDGLEAIFAPFLAGAGAGA